MDGIFSTLQRLSRICGLDDPTLSSTLSDLGLESPPEVTEEVDDEGRSVRRISTGLGGAADLSMPLGTWTLRLVPTPADTPDAVRIPIDIICSQDDGSFRELQIELARFELEADPNHLIAADLHTEPHTHLTPTEGRPPVKLLGPGFRLILRGDELDDFDAEFPGATGGSDPHFPSVRFEPPHFMIAVGGEPTDVGVVCDEVLLDLKRGANPSTMASLPGFEDSWRGLILKELGVFIGDGAEVGTWSGMAAMRNFHIGFDAVDLSGTFLAELVHYVLESDPQVQVRIYYEDQDGDEVLVADEDDAEIPRPPAVAADFWSGRNETRDFARVRLEAQPNWDSAGFRVEWHVPPGVSVEEPIRLTSLNLGWVRVPPGEHSFTVRVTDHRVDDQEETKVLHVAERPADGAGAMDLTVVLDGMLDAPGLGEGQRPTNRLHMTMRPGQRATLTARMGGGSGDPIDATLDLPSGFTTPDPIVQTKTRPAGSNVYELAEWVVQAPDPVPADPHAVFELTVEDAGAAVHRRLRVTTEDAPANHRDFELTSYADWRADPGIGLARIQPVNGLNFADIAWTLDSSPVTLDLFSNGGSDEFFTAPFDDSVSDPFDHREEGLTLSNSAGTVRPFLHTDGRLWRLTGVVAPDPLATTLRAPVVVGERPDSGALSDEVVADFLGDAPRPEAFASPGVPPARTILFHYDCDEIQPSGPACETEGPEHPSRRLSYEETNAEQARGFAALFRAIELYDDQIEEIGLFGAASIEGSVSYNLDLSERRVDAVRSNLVSPKDALRDAMRDLPAEESYEIPPAVETRIAALSGSDAITAAAFGERHAREVPIDLTTGEMSVEPQDRRVFAVLKLRDAASDQQIVHSEYFVTLPGAPPPAETPSVPTRQLQDHPFRHSVFRQAHVEVELLHNELVRLQVRLKLDLERFNENDLMPGGDLNELDGLTTFFLEMRRDPDPGPDEPEYAWELVALADPGDVDGFVVLRKPDHETAVDILGPPAIVTPALTTLAGGRIGITAFLVGVAVGEILASIPDPDHPLLDVQILIWRGIRFRLLHGNVRMPTISLAVDYTVRYHIDADLSGIGLPVSLQTDPQHPIEISFRNVGVEVRPGSVSVEFFYDPAQGFQLDINDPGVFRLGDGIGRLLSINRFRTGAGSPLWFEVELGLALETGIFSVDTLRVRLSLDTEQLFEADDGAVTLGADSIDIGALAISMNKLGVSVDVPGTLEGSGEFGITEEAGATTVEGQIDLSIMPIDIQIYGGLKIYSAEEFRALYATLGVEFAPGITLGPTGAAIYGFFGLVGVNMGRASISPPPDLPDALLWFAKDPVGVTDVDKWVPDRGSWAFGVGTVVGTVFDSGYSLNIKGAFILEIPGPRFMLAAEAKFIQKKPAVGSAERGDVLCVVMLDLENDLFLIGIDFRFVKENLLELRVPVEAFFNLADADDWHIRFGQWDPESKRVTLKLLNTFRAWGYFVLEGDGLHIPDRIDLEGICLALGARIEIFWGSRDINLYLEAFLELHIGLQIQPILLQGVVMVGGELHLVVITLGARGELRIIAPDPFVLRGEICGKIDLWLFSIEGCASFTIGDRDAELPDPETPFNELVIIDRMTSAAVPPVAEGQEPRAPLDAVLHLIFDQDMIDDRPEVHRALNLSDLGRPRNQVSDDMFYEYALQDVHIVRVSDDVVIDLWPADPPDWPEEMMFQSAWGPYTMPASDNGSDPAEDADSTRTLRLLDWIPQSHPRALDFTSGYGETLRALVSRLCDPATPPETECATFDEEPLGLNDAWLLNQGDLAPVFVVCSQANSLGAEHLGMVHGYGAARVVPLVPVQYDGRAAQEHCLRLPASIRTGQVELQYLVERWRELLAAGNEVESGLLWLTGLLAIRLPDLVSADVTLVVPERLVVDGQAVFLDTSVRPVSPVMSIQAAPVVAGSSGSGAYDQHVARSLSFGPPDAADHDPPRAAWLLIRAPSVVWLKGREAYSYLTDLCGITYGDWRRWRDRVGNKARVIFDLQRLTGILGGVPAATAQELLDPDEVYRVEGTIQWERFRDASSAENDGTGTFSFSQTFQTVGSDDYPREIRRYVLSHDPPDDDQPHYYEEPMEIVFVSDVIDKLYEKFGLQLVARAKADAGEHVLNQPLSDGAEREFFPFGSFEETLYDELLDLRDECLPGGWEWLFPKDVYTFEPLTQNTGYTVTLIPRPLAEPAGMSDEEWDRTLQEAFDNNESVFRFDIRTSRWGSFDEHMDAYDTALVGDVFADDETALDGALVEIVENRSDASVDRLCLALFGGPLALPDTPQAVRIWAPTGPPPDAFSTPPYRCRAILLDGPEPLLKNRSDGSSRVQVEARRTATVDAPFGSGSSLDGVRIIAGARGARLFILFDESTPPPAVQIRLRHQRKADDPTTDRILAIEVGDTPGSFDEEVD